MKDILWFIFDLVLLIDLIGFSIIGFYCFYRAIKERL